jgi:hypothetical protein
MLTPEASHIIHVLPHPCCAWCRLRIVARRRA